MDLMLHDIPEAVDRALRQRAHATGTTIDAVATDALSSALGVRRARQAPPGPPFHDMDWLLNCEPLEQVVLDAIAEADVVHPDDWK